jgi:hypothetical protein
MGAAWANTIAYATLAIITVGFSWRLYPIPYEWSRLLRIALAGVVAYVAATRIVPPSTPPLIGLFLRAAVTLAAYAAILFVAGFFHAGELRVLRDVRRRALLRKPVRTPEPLPNQVEMAGEIVATGPEAAGSFDVGQPTDRDPPDRRE